MTVGIVCAFAVEAVDLQDHILSNIYYISINMSAFSLPNCLGYQS